MHPGTELNKANLLTDAPAALMDLGSEATPDDMLPAMCTIRPLKDGIQQNLTKRSAPEYNERAVLSGRSEWRAVTYGGWPTVLADLIREEVVRMWEKRLLALLRLLLCLAWVLWLLTTEAC